MLTWLTGRRHEQFARRWLEQQGLTFVAQNVRFRQGEIDLIMRDSGTGCLPRSATAAMHTMAERLPVSQKPNSAAYFMRLPAGYLSNS